MATTKTGRRRRPPELWESQLWSALTAQAYFQEDARYRQRDAEYRAAHNDLGLYDFDSPGYSQALAKSALDLADEAYQELRAAYWRREREREERRKRP